jgi:hypothetical protein
MKKPMSPLVGKTGREGGREGTERSEGRGNGSRVTNHTTMNKASAQVGSEILTKKSEVHKQSILDGGRFSRIDKHPKKRMEHSGERGSIQRVVYG